MKEGKPPHRFAVLFLVRFNCRPHGPCFSRCCFSFPFVPFGMITDTFRQTFLSRHTNELLLLRRHVHLRTLYSTQSHLILWFLFFLRILTLVGWYVSVCWPRCWWIIEYVRQSVRQVSWLLFAGRRREWHEPCNAPRCLQSLTIERVVRDFRWWNLFAWIHDVLWREREREWDRRSFFSFYPSSHGWFGFFSSSLKVSFLPIFSIPRFVLFLFLFFFALPAHFRNV